MTDITKLADALNQLADDAVGVAQKPTSWSQGKASAFNTAAICVRTSLPKWTKFTANRSTWPDDGQMILATEDGSPEHPYVRIFRIKHVYSAWIGNSWRPMNDYDYPPKELK